MLRKPLNVKNSLVALTLSLTPNVGEAFRITNIHCTLAADALQFLTIQIDRVTVGYIQLGTTVMHQIPYQQSNQQAGTIFDQFRAAGIPLMFPVPEGSTFTVSTTANWDRLTIEYEIWDAADVKPTEPNGSQSKEYTFLQYGTYSVAITAAGNYTLDAVHNPVEFPNFPFGASVPSKTRMEILGIGCLAHIMSGAAFATDWIDQTRLRLYKEREVLFDEDRLGFVVDADDSALAANTTMYYMEDFSMLPYGGAGTYKPIFWLPSPLVFEAGEELAVQGTFTLAGAGATLAANTIYVCMPIRVIRS